MRGWPWCIVLLAGACLDPEPPDGAERCSPAGLCPDGYDCVQNLCYKKGHGPDLSGSVTDGGLDGNGNGDGSGAKHKGDPCAPGDACDTGFCVDQVCCESRCDGACQACNLLGSVGACGNVASGGPVGGRAACPGSGACAGSCTGASTCSFPSNQTTCGSACNGHCDGAGACSSTGGTACPNGFACGAGACKTSCGGMSDCQPFFQCNPPSCVRVAESDCLDGIDNNGDGLTDCQDPTCTALVSCEPAPPTGDELGVLSTGACAGNFATTEVFNQTLKAPSCDTSTCGACTMRETCSITISADPTAAACATKNFVATISLNSAVGAVCTDITSQPMKSVYVSQETFVSSQCTTPAVTPPVPPASWTTTKNFCAASRTSQTCAAGQVCVGKVATPGALCVRVPQAGAGCPAGYATGSSSTWYSGFTDTRACAPCGCVVNTPGQCNAPGSQGLIIFSQTNCAGSGTPTSGFLHYDGGTTTCLTGSWPSTFASVTYEANTGQGGTCSKTTATTGAAAATGGSTICCQ